MGRCSEKRRHPAIRISRGAIGVKEVVILSAAKDPCILSLFLRLFVLHTNATAIKHQFNSDTFRQTATNKRSRPSCAQGHPAYFIYFPPCAPLAGTHPAPYETRSQSCSIH